MPEFNAIQPVEGGVSSRALQDLENEIGELTDRLDDLESSGAHLDAHSGREALVFVYALGMGIALALSWIKHASILYAIGHGVLSWAYILYVALSR